MCLMFEKEIDSILDERKDKADHLIVRLGKTPKSWQTQRKKPLRESDFKHCLRLFLIVADNNGIVL